MSVVDRLRDPSHSPKGAKGISELSRGDCAVHYCGAAGTATDRQRILSGGGQRDS